MEGAGPMQGEPKNCGIYLSGSDPVAVDSVAATMMGFNWEKLPVISKAFSLNELQITQRWMDEHIKLLSGNTIEYENDFVDHNLHNISWWISKHNGYAIREAIDMLDIEIGLSANDNSNGLSKQAKNKRLKKTKYVKQPLFLRAFIYFIYRYIFKLGFIEGKEGFLWHFYQGWWYRTLVDTKILEIKYNCGHDKEKIKSYLLNEYEINID